MQWDPSRAGAPRSDPASRVERPRRGRGPARLRGRAPERFAPWLVALAIGVPLALLVALQLRTLARLEDTSVVAHRATLRGYGKAVLRPIEDLYRQHAQTALAAPAEGLGPDALAAHFAAQDARGVRRWFALAFAGDGEPAPRPFAAAGAPLPGAPPPGELHAIRVASAPWRVVASDGAALESPGAIVAEQDPEHRLILRPVLDARARVTGVLGLVIDEAWVRTHLLPEQIEAELGFFPDPLRGQVVAELRPRSDPTAPPPDDAVEVGFKFVFADQALAVRGRYDTPEQWARRSAGIQLALSLAAAGALGGAVLLALRNAARATKLSRMKTEFVSNVSHELRAPLASIRMFGELLRLGRVADPEKVRAYGESIEAESRRLTRLVDNIPDLARVEPDQKRYRLEPTDLGALVEETLEAFAMRVRQDGVALSLHAPPAPLPPVRLDPGAIEQVLTNLLDNAVKHGAGGRRIDVTLGRDGDQAT